MQYTTTISGLKKQGRILMIQLEFKKGVLFSFTPGQFIMVDYTDKNGTFKRSYSIASDPEHKHYLELCVSLKEDGRGSNVLKKAKKGQKLKINGPFGVFKLQENAKNDIILIAGGTGISPLRSMLKHLLNTNFPNHITMFYSFKTEKDFLYRKELEKLDKEHPCFELIPISTQPSKKWKGETEYVQNIFTRYVTSSKNKEIYACGPIVMVDAVFKSLKEKGFGEKQLHREIWSN